METKTATPQTDAAVPLHTETICKDTNNKANIQYSLPIIPCTDIKDLTPIAPENEPTLNELLAGAEIDLTTPLPAPPACLYIDDIVVYYLGDISTTIGKAKGRKTFASGLFLAALAGNCTIQNRIRAELPSNKNVVLSFDSEQSSFFAQRSATRILKLLNVETLPNFKAYGLRTFTPAERLGIIEHAVYNTPNLGFVCIDGIRDLITSINDEEQATMITSKLMKWSEELDIHINCVLHMNKGDNNARGHVGTELMNKSLTVLGVVKNEKQEMYSTIETIACRDKEPEPLTFGINDNGLPYLLEPEQMAILTAISDTKGKKSIQPTNYQLDTHTDNLKYHIFKNQSQMKYNELISNIKITYNVGDNKAKDFATYFINENLISRIQKGALSAYQIPV